MLIEHLFVYGTLAPNEPNHYLLENIQGDWQEAILEGWQRDNQFEIETGYPGIKPAAQSSLVKGHVLSGYFSKEDWSILDDFEGSEYARVLVKVSLANGNTADAFVYSIYNS